MLICLNVLGIGVLEIFNFVSKHFIHRWYVCGSCCIGYNYHDMVTFHPYVVMLLMSHCCSLYK